MESKNAIEALSALAHESRLSAFRLLVRAGEEGLPAGELARLLQVPANTLSTNLGILSRAGLVNSHREGRSIVYAANYDGMSKLVTFLMKDCCQGRAEVSAPVNELALSL
ncbi:MAG: winged helix-turn-helix domain-containing protein [Sphingomonadales bacterium]|nr:winged helix-turn-helix domain-containing protein [Sphingomonadales bacterium]